MGRSPIEKVQGPTDGPGRREPPQDSDQGRDQAVIVVTRLNGGQFGVNPDLVYQAIRGGLAGSTVLDAKAPLVMDGKFTVGIGAEAIRDIRANLDLVPL